MWSLDCDLGVFFAMFFLMRIRDLGIGHPLGRLHFNNI